jgi:hypothetical protein
MFRFASDDPPFVTAGRPNGTADHTARGRQWSEDCSIANALQASLAA